MSAAVSVVIPTYNSARFLAETLDSVFRQTVPPVEILVVDDGSTDGTGELVAHLARSSAVPLRWLPSAVNSGGPARPLNRGIAAAVGPLIATLDHDDLMSPFKLERQVACWEQDRGLGLIFTRVARFTRCGRAASGDPRPAPLAAAAARAVVEGLRREPLGRNCYRIPAAAARDGLISGCFARTCSSFVFPRETWEVCGGFDEGHQVSCDYGFLGAVAERFDLGFVDETLTYWRNLEVSFSNSSNNFIKTIERIKVLERLRGRVSPGERATTLLQELRQELLEAAYGLRQEGNYRGALQHYLGSMRRGGVSRAALFGIVKLVPHRLLRRSGRTDGRNRPWPTS
jgi:glycosyltransferase involved in cell wall biosynthesis